MTREEDNRKMIEVSSREFSGDYHHIMLGMMGTIATVLFDISKSLAIIADALRPERDLKEFLKEDYGEPKPPEEGKQHDD